MSHWRNLLTFCLMVAGAAACGDEGDTCTDAPECISGTVEVASCTGRTACEGVTACNETIFCADPDEPCNATPSCNAGETVVGSCAGQTACRTVTVCDATIYCDGPDTCTQTPQCAANENQVPSCAGQSNCRNVTSCGQTIYCASATTCDGVCDAGYDDVAGCASAPLCITESCDGLTAYCFPFDTATCDENADCPEFHYCQYPDGRCGAGAAGKCEPYNSTCSDQAYGQICYCGNVTLDGKDDDCRGKDGRDFDATGSCSIPLTAIVCGHLFCDNGDDDFCTTLPASETDGVYLSGSTSCGRTPACDGPGMDCDCPEIQSRTTDCNGTCTDTPNGPIITCQPG